MATQYLRLARSLKINSSKNFISMDPIADKIAAKAVGSNLP